MDIQRQFIADLTVQQAKKMFSYRKSIDAAIQASYGNIETTKDTLESSANNNNNQIDNISVIKKSTSQQNINQKTSDTVIPRSQSLHDNLSKAPNNRSLLDNLPQTRLNAFRASIPSKGTVKNAPQNVAPTGNKTENSPSSSSGNTDITNDL